MAELDQTFEAQGYAVIEDLLSPEEVDFYADTYDRFLDGTINCGERRTDLGSGFEKKGAAENITQIMWPSALLPLLHLGPYHRRAGEIARGLLGDDIALDFDMLIDKVPRSGTPTPWHQDAAYWLDLPDRRAASIWLALDEATLDNGCMWYVPGSHQEPLRAHRHSGDGGRALVCECEEDEAVPVPLRPGSAVIHGGATLHYARGNQTGGHRRAFILNFRPEAMVRLEREQGVDHGLTDNVSKVRNAAAGGAAPHSACV